MQKKVEEKRKEMDKKPESGGGGVAGGGADNKTVSSEAHSRQSSAYNTPRNARYRNLHTTYYESNVGLVKNLLYI